MSRAIRMDATIMPINHDAFQVSRFKDNIVVFTVTHYQAECVKIAIDNMLGIMRELPDVYLVLLDSASQPDVRAYVSHLMHDRMHRVMIPLNIGYIHAINYYISGHISDANLPRVVVSLGPDIVFSCKDFQNLIDAVDHLPQYGTLSLSYKDNTCNPEMNIFFPPKKVIGTNGKAYYLRRPVLSPVAGGIMGFRGRILKHDLQYVPFQMRYLPKKYRNTAYGGADASLYNALKWRYKNAYLADTCAVHMKSQDGVVLDIPDT